MASKTPHRGRKTNASQRTKEKNLRNQQRAIVDGVNHIVNPAHGTIRTEYVERRVERMQAKRKKSPMDLSQPQSNKRGKALQQHVFGSGPDPEWSIATNRPKPTVFYKTRRIRLRQVETLHFWRYLVASSQKEEEEGVIMTKGDYDTFDRDDTSELERTTHSEVTTDKDGREVIVETVDTFLELVPVDVAFYNVSINTDRIYEWARDKRIHKTELAQAVASILRNQPDPYISIMGVDYNCMRKGLAVGGKGASKMLERMFEKYACGLPAELLVMNKWKGTRDNLHIIPIWAIHPLLCSLPQSVIEINDIYGLCFELYSNLYHKAPRDVGFRVERLNQALKVLKISLRENDEHFRALSEQKLASGEEMIRQMQELTARMDASEAYAKTKRCQTDDKIFKLSEEMASWSKRIEAVEETTAELKRESDEGKRRKSAGGG